MDRSPYDLLQKHLSSPMVRRGVHVRGALGEGEFFRRVADSDPVIIRGSEFAPLDFAIYCGPKTTARTLRGMNYADRHDFAEDDASSDYLCGDFKVAIPRMSYGQVSDRHGGNLPYWASGITIALQPSAKVCVAVFPSNDNVEVAYIPPHVIRSARNTLSPGLLEFATSIPPAYTPFVVPGGYAKVSAVHERLRKAATDPDYTYRVPGSDICIHSFRPDLDGSSALTSNLMNPDHPNAAFRQGIAQYAGPEIFKFFQEGVRQSTTEAQVDFAPDQPAGGDALLIEANGRKTLWELKRNLFRIHPETGVVTFQFINFDDYKALHVFSDLRIWDYAFFYSDATDTAICLPSSVVEAAWNLPSGETELKLSFQTLSRFVLDRVKQRKSWFYDVYHRIILPYPPQRARAAFDPPFDFYQQGSADAMEVLDWDDEAASEEDGVFNVDNSESETEPESDYETETGSEAESQRGEDTNDPAQHNLHGSDNSWFARAAIAVPRLRDSDPFWIDYCINDQFAARRSGVLIRQYRRHPEITHLYMDKTWSESDVELYHLMGRLPLTLNTADAPVQAEGIRCRVVQGARTITAQAAKTQETKVRPHLLYHDRPVVFIFDHFYKTDWSHERSCTIIPSEFIKADSLESAIWTESQRDIRRVTSAVHLQSVMDVSPAEFECEATHMASALANIARTHATSAMEDRVLNWTIGQHVIEQNYSSTVLDVLQTQADFQMEYKQPERLAYSRYCPKPRGPLAHVTDDVMRDDDDDDDNNNDDDLGDDDGEDDQVKDTGKHKGHGSKKSAKAVAGGKGRMVRTSRASALSSTKNSNQAKKTGQVRKIVVVESSSSDPIPRPSQDAVDAKKRKAQKPAKFSVGKKTGTKASRSYDSAAAAHAGLRSTMTKDSAQRKAMGKVRKQVAEITSSSDAEPTEVDLSSSVDVPGWSDEDSEEDFQEGAESDSGSDSDRDSGPDSDADVDSDVSPEKTVSPKKAKDGPARRKSTRIGGRRVEITEPRVEIFRRQFVELSHMAIFATETTDSQPLIAAVNARLRVGTPIFTDEEAQLALQVLDAQRILDYDEQEGTVSLRQGRR